MHHFLLKKFESLAENKDLARPLFYQNILKNYTENGRFYHDISHIKLMLETFDNLDFYTEFHFEFEKDKPVFTAFLYAIFYHDIIYKPLRSDNEEQSAEFAKRDMKLLNIDEKIIEATEKLILATKTHQVSAEIDNPTLHFATQVLLDLDLAVLGQKPNIYKRYAENIRQEYWLIPPKIYAEGRKKVLKYFLNMPNIYKTSYFYNQFENQAKQNLENEYSNL